MNKKEIKILIIITVIFLIIISLSYVIFTNIEEKKNYMNANIIVDGDRFLAYISNNWEDLKTIDALNMKKFKVYSNNNYVNNYSISENNKKFYFFDDKYKSHKINSPFIAINIIENINILE